MSGLIGIRVIQGFFGGMLIPPVFTGAFLLIDDRRRVLATTIAGACAMVAPAIGPLVGGYLTELHSWRLIFLVNIPPGILVAGVVAGTVRLGKPDLSVLRKIDYSTMILAALFLASLEVVLNEGPRHDWQGTYIMCLIAVTVVSGLLAIWRALSHATPFIDLRRFRRGNFSIGCAYSFVLGFGLYGSIYLLALFLGLVRGHSPLLVGEIMVVTGIARLAVAPVAAILEVRIRTRILIAIGFGLFAIGVFANAASTATTDFAGLLWPQIFRGAAMMLCLLPATRLALDGWPPEDVADASGLFNLMRNLGGAIGISVMDTIVQQRTAGHVAALAAKLQAGNPDTARLVGLPAGMFHNRDMGFVDPITRAIVAPLVRHAGLTQSINEGWMVMGVLFALSLLMLPAVGRKPGR
jgi:DHA2 family multidrug resistance protein